MADPNHDRLEVLTRQRDLLFARLGRVVKDEGDDVRERFAAAKLTGGSGKGSVAMELAEEHRRHIDRWFYRCSTEVHVGLGATYVADERFTQYRDAAAPGLAEYVNDAIWANAGPDRT